jgi:hypothetical protein
VVIYGIRGAQLKAIGAAKETPAKLETGQCLAGMLPADPTEFLKGFDGTTPGTESVVVDTYDPARYRINTLSCETSGQDDGQEFTIGQCFWPQFLKFLPDLVIAPSAAE